MNQSSSRHQKWGWLWLRQGDPSQQVMAAYQIMKGGLYPDQDWQRKVRVNIVEAVREKIRKRKASPEVERCYGCGVVNHYIANWPVVICFCCDGEVRRAPECPWNPKTRQNLPIVRWTAANRNTTQQLTTNKPNNTNIEEASTIPTGQQQDQWEKTVEGKVKNKIWKRTIVVQSENLQEG